MNVDRILALADLIEKQPHVKADAKAGFNMSTWVHPCGTPSCIAGWAASMAGVNMRGSGSSRVAMAYLGLGQVVVEQLFLGPFDDLNMVTPSQAASTLRHLAKTGEVNWEVGQ